MFRRDRPGAEERAASERGGVPRRSSMRHETRSVYGDGGTGDGPRVEHQLKLRQLGAKSVLVPARNVALVQKRRPAGTSRSQSRLRTRARTSGRL